MIVRFHARQTSRSVGVVIGLIDAYIVLLSYAINGLHANTTPPQQQKGLTADEDKQHVYGIPNH